MSTPMNTLSLDSRLRRNWLPPGSPQHPRSKCWESSTPVLTGPGGGRGRWTAFVTSLARPDGAAPPDLDQATHQVTLEWIEGEVMTLEALDEVTGLAAALLHAEALLDAREGVTQPRLQRAVAWYGWGPISGSGEPVAFERRPNGWRLGNGTVVTGWGSGIPDDPLEALRAIETRQEAFLDEHIQGPPPGHPGSLPPGTELWLRGELCVVRQEGGWRWGHEGRQLGGVEVLDLDRHPWEVRLPGARLPGVPS